LHTIAKAIETVREQYAIELLCIDSASTDNSPELIDACGARRVDSMKGVGHANVKGIQAVKGRHVIRTDGDTLWPSTLINAHMRHYDEDTDVVGVAAKHKFDEKLHPLYPLYFDTKEMVRRWILSLPGVRNALLTVGAPNVWWAGSNMSWDNDVIENKDTLVLPDNAEDTAIGKIIEATGRRIVQDASEENTVLTSGRRYHTVGQVLAEIGRDLLRYFDRHALGKKEIRCKETLVDIRHRDTE